MITMRLECNLLENEDPENDDLENDDPNQKKDPQNDRIRSINFTTLKILIFNREMINWEILLFHD